MEDIQWLRSQPLYLNMKNLRVVHACWDKKLIKFLKNTYPKQMDGDELLRKSVIPGSKENQLIEILLSGKNVYPGKSFYVTNSAEKPVNKIQVKWWMNPAGKTLKELAFGAYRFQRYRLISKEEMNLFSEYPVQKKLLFMGHYCLNGYTGILQENLCCVDFCCYRTGWLAAYRWSGESKLSVKNMLAP